MPLTVQILTPERSVFDADDAEYVAAPGAGGDIGILPGHAPFVTPTVVGEVRIDRGGESESFAVTAGMLEIVGDRVQILAQSAEHEGDIDHARATAAQQRAEERLTGDDPDNNVDRAEAALARALNRLRVGGHIE